MIDDEYETLRDWLRVKWIPGYPSGDEILRYDDYLALSDAEQSALMETMSGNELEIHIELETARALYVDPIDRESGITEAKVARYPERYRWPPKDGLRKSTREHHEDLDDIRHPSKYLGSAGGPHAVLDPIR